MQVHRDDAVCPGRGQQVGHQLGRDRLSGEHLMVLARVAVVGDDRRDALGGCPLQRVDHHQLFHDHLVDRIRVRLDDERIGSPNALVGPDVDLARGEPGYLGVAQLDLQLLGDLVGKHWMCRAGEDHHPLTRGDIPMVRDRPLLMRSRNDAFLSHRPPFAWVCQRLAFPPAPFRRAPFAFDRRSLEPCVARRARRRSPPQGRPCRSPIPPQSTFACPAERVRSTSYPSR